MKRRDFFGTLALAGLAGPAVAQTFVEQKSAEAINGAIEGLRNTGFRGQVVLPAGIIEIRTPILLRAGVSVMGQGWATRLKHAPGVGGALIQQADGDERVIYVAIRDLYLEGNGDDSETHGIDLSGISYGQIENVRIRKFRRDGIFADGAIQPKNRQVSNLLLSAVASNNNGRHGLHLRSDDPHANTAITITGSEFTGNDVDGVHISTGQQVSFYGCTMQGNGRFDIADGGRGNLYDAPWIENRRARTVHFSGEAARLVRPRSSYPLWNTVVDEGQNSAVILDDGAPDVGRPLFPNPGFQHWPDDLPEWVSAVRGTTMVKGPGDGTLAGLTARAEGQGFDLLLPKHLAPLLAGRWVTYSVRMRADRPTKIRVSCVAGQPNDRIGEYAAEDLPEGAWVYRHYDVRMPERVVDQPAVRHLLGAPVTLADVCVLLGRTWTAGASWGLRL